MTKNQENQCDWCGKKAAYFWQDEMLCEHCWEYIKMTESKKSPVETDPLKVGIGS